MKRRRHTPEPIVRKLRGEGGARLFQDTMCAAMELLPTMEDSTVRGVRGPAPEVRWIWMTDVATLLSAIQRHF